MCNYVVNGDTFCLMGVTGYMVACSVVVGDKKDTLYYFDGYNQKVGVDIKDLCGKARIGELWDIEINNLAKSLGIGTKEISSLRDIVNDQLN